MPSPHIKSKHPPHNQHTTKRGFNGKEMVDEMEGDGNAYDFGARIFSPRLGRWFSCDALEAKYPNISPYVFVDNMPIGSKDPNGKEIWIAITTQENDGRTEIQYLYYSNNKLYTPDGEEYFGNDDFANKVLSDLNTLKTDNEIIKTRIDKLEISEEKHVIMNPNDGDFNRNGHSEEDAKNHIRTGSIIYYNPDGIFTINGESRNPRCGFAHEISHSWDADQGIKDFGEINGIPMYEINAVKFENLVREITGDNKRTKYGGIEIPDDLLNNNDDQTIPNEEIKNQDVNLLFEKNNASGIGL
jgi:RHS repeat-associated protein